MSKTNSAVKLTRDRRTSETVVLYGSPDSQQVKSSQAKLKRQGREVVIQARPSFDTGTGMCGNICTCKEYCKAQY